MFYPGPRPNSMVLVSYDQLQIKAFWLLINIKYQWVAEPTLNGSSMQGWTLGYITQHFKESRNITYCILLWKCKFLLTIISIVTAKLNRNAVSYPIPLLLGLQLALNPGPLRGRRKDLVPITYCTPMRQLSQENLRYYEWLYALSPSCRGLGFKATPIWHRFAPYAREESEKAYSHLRHPTFLGGVACNRYQALFLPPSRPGYVQG